MNLVDLITGNIGGTVTTQIEEKYGIDKGKIMVLLATATPFIVSALQKKSENPNEAEVLNNALDRDHDGSILNNPQKLFERQEEGSSILNHIFGDKKENVENQLSATTSISMDKLVPILSALAPIIMGFIGKQKQSQAVNSGGIADLLGSLINGKDNPLGNILGNILGGTSQGNSDNAVTNVLEKVLGRNEKKADGVGSLLGKLFGKK